MGEQGTASPPSPPPDLAHVFTPATPVRTRTRLHGRRQRLAEGDAVLAEPGRHLLVLGEPGVGRTSFCLSLAEGLPIRYHTVGLDDRFDVLVSRLLYARERSAPEHAPYAASSPSTSPAPSDSLPHQATAWTAADLPRQTVIVIDDLDQAAHPSLEEGIVPLLRALATAATGVTVILVARQDRPLPPALSGVGLRLHALALGRLGETALRATIDQGAAEAGLRFEPLLRDRIALDSDGLPGFVHALCLEAARSALRAGRRDVRLDTDYLPALQAVVDSLSPALAEAYASATAGRGRRNRYAHLLWAAAAIPTGRFGLTDLMDGIARIEGQPVPQQGFAIHLGDLLQRSLLARLPDGTYRFTDPAMRAYVRLLLRRDHPTLLGEDPLQLALPY